MVTFSYKSKNALLVIAVVLVLCSCKDTKIAKNMEGTWKRSYVTSYEDGTKSHVNEQITYNYDASDKENDGGTFVEICTGQEEADDDEFNAKYRWVSKIEGTWKIELGNLYQHYNISTLEVEIGKDDVDLKVKDEAWLWNDWGELLSAGLYAQQTFYKDLKKNTYKELFRAYKRLNNQDNQDIGFPDVQINGSVLSYETSDMGKVKFYRVKEKHKHIRKKEVDTPPEEKEDEIESATKLNVTNVEYSQNLEEEAGNTYVPANMLDGKASTAWAVNLDKANYDSDKLYGPVFYVECKKLSHIVIRNGYAKDENTFKNNARASRIIFCNPENVRDEDESTSYLYVGILKDILDEQTIDINPTRDCNRDIKKVQIIIPVDGIRHGEKWNDLCISEIEFYGY